MSFTYCVLVLVDFVNPACCRNAIVRKATTQQVMLCIRIIANRRILYTETRIDLIQAVEVVYAHGLWDSDRILERKNGIGFLNPKAVEGL